MKTNCWEFMKCERQPGGSKVDEFGVCPAATEVKADGINQGSNGGRACWAITGTLCEDKVQGEFAVKLGNCIACDFYKLVRKEEGENFQGGKQVLEKLT